MGTFPGRVEARMVVPSPGASYVASIGASTTSYSGTIPAANYYMTAAGNVSSLLTVFQTQLNQNLLGFPANSSAMQHAIGGKWSTGAGWLFNIASGNDTGAFGGVTMTAASTPTYSNTGIRTGDLAIGFDSAADAFTAGDTFDVNVGDDLVLVWVAKFTTLQTSATLMSKRGAGAGYAIFCSAAGFQFDAYDGVAALDPTTGSGSAQFVGEWHVGMAVIDRGAGTMRVATRGLTSGTSIVGPTTSVATLGSLANADTFTLGGAAFTGTAPIGATISALYVVSGASVASGLSAGMSTAIVNLANAVNASWVVALDSSGTSPTGRITISNSFWQCAVSFTTTQLRDVLGYAYDIDYPQTAAQVRTALGSVGDFTNGVGYLLNEAAGNPASVFGTPSTLTAAGSPSYSNPGIRGGTGDKAVGFTINTDNFAATSTDFDIATSTTDMIVVWAAQFSAVPNGTNFLGKGAGAVGYWLVTSATGISLLANNGSSYQTAEVSAQIGERHVGIAVIDRSTGKMRIGTYGLRSGTSSVSAEVTVGAVNFTNANAWKVGNWGGGGTANTNVTYSVLYAVVGVGVATGVSAGLSTALSSLATYMSSQTTTTQARGVWIPDSLCSTENDPRRAPKVSDKMDMESPTGIVVSLVSATKRRQRSVMWSLVTADRVWETSSTYAHGSFEWFWDETQLGAQSTWFKPGSLIQIYNYDGSRVGQDVTLDGWSITGVDSVDDIVKRHDSQGYVGLWNITLPELKASG